MTQINTGLRSVLAHPLAYNAFQNIVGATRVRAELVREYIRPEAGQRILDLGCGTADILNHLPADVEYYGIDHSPEYIDHARKRFPDRGHFLCAPVGSLYIKTMPAMDVVLSTGVIHHLGDDAAGHWLRAASDALDDTGTFVALDPCYSAAQNFIAKWTLSKDRGRHIRTRDAYESLARRVFAHVSSDVRNMGLRIPYTHHIMTCRK